MGNVCTLDFVVVRIVDWETAAFSLDTKVWKASLGHGEIACQLGSLLVKSLNSFSYVTSTFLTPAKLISSSI
uniref:Uncharacterized protein n=1 Tax=Arundo donax TaxID=35708 RepID=A0A0A9ACV0_ARUDO